MTTAQRSGTPYPREQIPARTFGHTMADTALKIDELAAVVVRTLTWTCQFCMLFLIAYVIFASVIQLAVNVNDSPRFGFLVSPFKPYTDVTADEL